MGIVTPSGWKEIMDPSMWEGRGVLKCIRGGREGVVVLYNLYVI